jgi:outer membrane phospholipase A
MFASPVNAAELSPLLSLPETPQAAGHQTVLALYLFNDKGQELKISLPEQLAISLTTEDGRTIVLPAEGRFKGHPLSLERDRFFKKEYQFQIPVELIGRLHVSVAGYSQAQGVLVVREASADASFVSSAESMKATEIYPTLGSLFTLYQPYIANISAYEPIYFLVGSNPEKSKFQLSMKYRLFNPEGTLSKRHTWLQGFHFGYTQTSFWDLHSDSAPFADTSYKPELFFLTTNFRQRPHLLQGLFFQVGLQHESNGRSGKFSRSTNYAYLKPYFIYYNPRTKLGLQFSPKLLVYINNDETTNPDLPDYRGYFELEAKFGKADSFLLTSNLRLAERGPSLQVDLSYPISNLLGNNFDLYLQIEYSNSLAESLIDYRQRDQVVRIGISIVR